MAPHLSYLQDKEDLCHLWNLWDKKNKQREKKNLWEIEKASEIFRNLRL